MFPQDAASGVLSGDGLLLLADGLQSGRQENTSSQDVSNQDDEGDDLADGSTLRKQHLLTCLAIACRFQPSTNFMAGEMSLFL